ncbi:MAG: amidohydrolase family protein [Planctomycetota bacterium]
MIIDSHHHLWRYDSKEYAWIDDSMAELRHDFLVPELAGIAEASQIDGFVSVQARQTLSETDALLQMAAESDLIRGVVGWVPLADESVGDILAIYGDTDWLRGVRHVVQNEPDDRFLLRNDFNRGIAQLSDAGLVYDLLIFAKQLPAAIEFVDAHPDLPIVLDHIAKPTIQAAQFDSAWESNLRELARRDHVHCKFSGVVTEVRDDQWTLDVIQRYWDVTLDAFTPDRLMFGSDWPVCLLATDYARWLSSVQMLAKQCTESERRRMFADNAIAFYGLSR